MNTGPINTGPKTVLAHISDLHFGREDPDLVQALLASLAEARPDVIVVSGDLTQRARKGQFRKARAFLRALPAVPHLVVPGNHDVSATNLLTRLARPLKRYRRYIARRPLPIPRAPGRIHRRHQHRPPARPQRRPRSTTPRSPPRAGNSHPPPRAPSASSSHTTPSTFPPPTRENAPIARAAMALHAFSNAQVDLFLSGHLHTGQAMVTTEASFPYAAIVAHARNRRLHPHPRRAQRLEPHPPRSPHRRHHPADALECRSRTFRPRPDCHFQRGPHGWVLGTP